MAVLHGHQVRVFFGETEVTRHISRLSISMEPRAIVTTTLEVVTGPEIHDGVVCFPDEGAPMVRAPSLRGISLRDRQEPTAVGPDSPRMRVLEQATEDLLGCLVLREGRVDFSQPQFRALQARTGVDDPTWVLDRIVETLEQRGAIDHVLRERLRWAMVHGAGPDS